MWALRRASSYPLKTQVLNIATIRASSGIGPLDIHNEANTSSFKHPVLDRWIRSEASSVVVHVPNRFSPGKRSLSSQAGAKSGGANKDDLEEGFSELETNEPSKSLEECNVDDITSTSESELSGDEENHEDVLEESELKIDTEAKDKHKTLKISYLCQLILEERGSSIFDALDKYDADGKDLSRCQIYDTLLQLRKFKRYAKALQLSEWLEKNERLEFVERDYASRVDLIAKVQGVDKAEDYIGRIPESYRKELVYRTLLANCVSTTNVKKAEEVFNKMKHLGFSMTTFACNQLLLLYKKTDKKKIAEVLVMMEKENVKPTRFTYQILIDVKGFTNDVVGMDRIVETMKAEGVEPGIQIQATLARHYASAGLNDKAESILKKLEGNTLNVNRFICPILFAVYAELGKADEVARVWEVCESKPRQRECLAAIRAWGKLNNIEKAEEIFEKMSESKKKLLPATYAVMLKAYAENKMLTKGKELVKRMGDNGCHIGPTTWDALVKLYVEAGEVKKADSILQKAGQQSPQKPMFNSYMTILDRYADRGDIDNSEKIFDRMRRQVGYVSRARTFRSLLQAYVNAKVPAYGFRERMKAENIFPDKALAAQLAQVDSFKKNGVSDLLD